MNPRLVVFTASSDIEQAALVAGVALVLGGAGRNVLVLDTAGVRDGDVPGVDRTGPPGSVSWALRHLPMVESGPALEAKPRFDSPRPANRELPPGLVCTVRSMPGRLVVVAPPTSDVSLLDDVRGLWAQTTGDPTSDDLPVVLVHARRRPDEATVDVLRTTADAVVLIASGPLDDDTRDLLAGLHARRSDAPPIVCVTVEHARVGERPARLAELVSSALAPAHVPESALTVVPMHPDDRMLVASDLPAPLLAPESQPAGAVATVARVVAGLDDLPGALPTILTRQAPRVRRSTSDGVVRGIAYHPSDRLSADRVAGWLQDAGLGPYRYRPGDPVPAGGDPPLVVLSAANPASAWDLGMLPEGAVGVVLGGEGRLISSELPTVDLRSIPEPDRRAVLLGGLDLLLSQGAGPAGPIPPSDPTRGLGSVPARGAYFVGRVALLERVRDAFAPLDGSRGPVAVVLQGEPGVGKSATAVAYVNRFAEDYAGVVYGSARNAAAVNDVMGALILARAAADPDERGWSHWLVVLDDADPDVLAGMPEMPSGTHVLITAGSSVPSADALILQVDRLDAAEGALLLRDPDAGLAGLGRDETATVVDAVGGLPLSLGLARSFLRDHTARLQADQWTENDAVDSALASLRSSAAGESPLSGILAALRDSLVRHDRGRLLVRLSELASFVSADGIDLAVVRSRAFVEVLSAAADTSLVLADELELDRVLAEGDRVGLFDVNWRSPATVRMHRVLQRATIDILDAEQRAQRQAEALTALARYAPISIGPEQTTSGLEELDRHVAASGAVHGLDDPAVRAACGDPADPTTDGWTIRRWVVEQLNHRRHRGGPDELRSTLEVARRLEESWAAAYGSADPLRLRLLDVQGALLDALERNDEAREIDGRALDETARVLGSTHPRAINLTGGLAGDLRRLGRFQDELPEASWAWRTLVEQLGRAHPRTLAAAQNLAESRFFSGRHFLALELQRESHQDRRQVFGESHPWWWGSLRALGVYLRETGDLTAAEGALLEASLHSSAVPGSLEDLERLKAKRALRVTRRRTRGRRRDLDADRRLLEEITEVFGSEHSETSAARAGLAVELAETDGHAARRLASAAVEELTRALSEDHPFVGAALVTQAVVAVRSGDARAALETGRRADAQLDGPLDDVHPWRLAAASNRARLLALSGAEQAAEELLRDTLALCSGYLDEDSPADRDLDAVPVHPVSAAVSANRDASVELGIGLAARQRWVDIDIDIPSR